MTPSKKEELIEDFKLWYFVQPTFYGEVDLNTIIDWWLSKIEQMEGELPSDTDIAEFIKEHPGNLNNFILDKAVWI